MNVLLTGFVAGLALAIPLGPMALLLISTTLKRGRNVGAFGALAMASVDFAYALIVFAFGSVVVNALVEWQFWLRLLGSLLLVLLAIKIFIDAIKSRGLAMTENESASGSRFKTYAKFFGLTVINPATAFYFFGITPSVAALSSESGTASIFYFAFGVFFGSIIWQMSLVGAAQLTRMFTNAKFQMFLQIAGAVLIVALAVGLQFFGA